MPSEQEGRNTTHPNSYSYSEEYEASTEYESYTPTISENTDQNHAKGSDEYYSYSETKQKSQDGEGYSGEYYSYSETNPQKPNQGDAQSGDYYSYSESGEKRNTSTAEGQSGEYYSYSETNQQRHNPESKAESDQYYSYSGSGESKGSYYSYSESNSNGSGHTRPSTYYSYTQSNQEGEKAAEGEEYYDYSYRYSERGSDAEKTDSYYTTAKSKTKSDYSTYYYSSQDDKKTTDINGFDSYSYTNDGSGEELDYTYYTYDDSYKRESGSYTDASPSYDYYYSSKYTDSYSKKGYSKSYYTGDSYQYSSSYTKLVDDGSYESETDGATTENDYSSDIYTYSSVKTSEKRSADGNQLPAHQLLSTHAVYSGITSSDTADSSSTKSSSKNHRDHPREYLVIRAPQEVSPKFFTPPSSCYVNEKSPDDFINDFIDRLMDRSDHQDASIPLTTFEVGGHTKIKSSKKKKKLHTSSSSDAVYEGDCLRQKSIRCALKILQLGHVERKEVTKVLMSTNEENDFFRKFRSVIEAQVKKKFIGAFVNHDPHRTGEISLEVVLTILLTLGIGTGPIIDNYRISICLKDNVVMLCVEHHKNGSKEEPETFLFDVAGASTTHKKGELSLRFSVSRASLMVGKNHMKFLIHDAVSLNRLKQYCISYSYLSAVVQQCAFRDRAGTCKIHYPPLVRAILVMMSPPQRMDEAVLSVFLSNAFRSIYLPVESLHEYLPLPVQTTKGHVQAESALVATTDNKQKTRRNVVPPIHDSQVVEVHPVSPTSSFIEVCIKKVRIPSAIPEGCQPYCLVSAVSADSAFLPAVKIPVVGIRASSKEGFTWIFGNKNSKNSYQTLIRGSDTDRLYIECCYEEKNTVTVNNVSRVDTTVWCAGYCSVLLTDLKTTTVAVCPGSLLDPPSAEENCERGKRESKKKKSALASGVKIEVSKASKEVNKIGALLAERCIVLKRHLHLAAELRAAITYLGVSQSTHAIQALRHQYAEKAFLVSSDVELLDDLKSVWSAKRAKMTKQERDLPHHDLLLQCAAGVAAAFNCSKKPFSSSLISHRKLQFNHFAPSEPVPC